MFKKFEAFGDASQTFDKKVELLLLIQNIGVGQGSFDLELELDPVRFPYLTTLLDGDKLVKIPNKFPKISMIEKGHIEKIFNSLDSKYKISQLPDIHAVRKYFSTQDPFGKPIDKKEIGLDIEETIVLQKIGSVTDYGNRIKKNKTHYRFRMVFNPQDGSSVDMDIQDKISTLLTNLEKKYKTEFVIDGDSTWTQYKVMVSSY